MNLSFKCRCHQARFRGLLKWLGEILVAFGTLIMLVSLILGDHMTRWEQFEWTSTMLVWIGLEAVWKARSYRMELMHE